MSTGARSAGATFAWLAMAAVVAGIVLLPAQP
jgi:hypothetical protein